MKENVVIVTGGSSGMGKAIAKKLVEEGAHVVITGRTMETLLEAQQEMERNSGGEVMIFQMDVRNSEQAQSMVAQTKKRFGKIDGLVNNAAGNFTCAAEDLSYNAWHAVVNIVLHGTWYCTQAVGKDWIADGRRGKILNMLASYAWTGAAGVAPSASAKAGVLAMTRTLAVEWGYRYGIQVNAIAPGPIADTGGVSRLISNDDLGKLTLDSVPLGRFGRVEEIAELACFLLSSKADYINGECITMDGGQWLHRGTFKERLDETVQNRRAGVK